MDTYSNSEGNHGSPISDKSEKIQTGFRNVVQGVKDTGAAVADTYDSVVGKAKDSSQSAIASVKSAIDQTRTSAVDSSEALITYTKENPVKALLIAAASGALLWTLLKAIGSRD